MASKAIVRKGVRVRVPPRVYEHLFVRRDRDDVGVDPCPRCREPHRTPDVEGGAPYAYLLGQYLGDGFLARHPRGVYALRISCCARYPGILAETRSAVVAVAPRGRASLVRAPGVTEVKSYSKAWPCLLPQHGPGRKHERAIALVDWQQRIVDRHSGAFVRGLLHADGWRGDNRVIVGGREYVYARYNFSNRSDDIRALFCAALDRLDIAWRPMNRWNISVARRDAVAALDAIVGPKA